MADSTLGQVWRLDDLTTGPLDEDAIWVATNPGNTVVAVRPDGSTIVVVAFGRTWKDRDILYVVTGGGLAGPVNGTLTEGGELIAIGTTRLRWSVLALHYIFGIKCLAYRQWKKTYWLRCYRPQGWQSRLMELQGLLGKKLHRWAAERFLVRVLGL